MKVFSRVDEIYPPLDFLRCQGKRIGLVPTMGALHEGHYSLVRRSVSECDTTVVTIFVNPSQFGPREDLSRYPRTLDQDLEGLRRAGAHYVFVPDAGEMYPPGYSTWVEPPEVANRLEGDFRPGHYRGVATIVLKLFNAIPATVAYFGQKDYQQWLVIRGMVDDLNVPVRIQACPTVREADGLAMSSRNRYLNTEERQQALCLSLSLRAVANLINAGETDVSRLEATMHQILTEARVSAIDYARVVDAETLETITHLDRSCVALIAARIGATRLIDNQVFD